jgi:hypothetical protein
VAVEQTGVVTDMGEFTVVEATDSDTDSLLRMRDDVAQWLVDRGIDQWQPGEIPCSWERGDEYFVFVLCRGEDRVGTLTILWDDPVILLALAGSSAAGAEGVPPRSVGKSALGSHRSGPAPCRRLTVADRTGRSVSIVACTDAADPSPPGSPRRLELR